MRKVLKSATVILIILLTCIGCGSRPEKDIKAEAGKTGKVDSNIETSIPVGSKTGDEEAEEQDTAKDSEKAVEKLLGDMSLEEKVGQVFIAAFRLDENKQPLKNMDAGTTDVIKQFNPGGVILFGENVDSIPQTMKLINDFQSASKMPLFIAIDEEGGRVSRLNSSVNMHVTKLPGNRILGRTGNNELAYKAGVILGRELSALGFNMNFAPVADLDTNPKNPVIGDRSFGRNPQKAGKMVAEMVKGMQDQNVISVLKHFPGHGDTEYDTHEEKTVIKYNRDELEARELVPFKLGIEAGADAVMTAHIHLPAITTEDVPATFSKEVLTGILRQDMNFDGLIITDALEMGAISRYWSPEEAAVNAFSAGADILLMPSSLERVYYGLLQAVKDGIVTEKRLDESVLRILKVKEERGILEKRGDVLDAEKVLGCEEHSQIVKNILEQSVN